MTDTPSPLVRLSEWAEGCTNVEMGDYHGTPVVKLTVPIAPPMFEQLRLKTRPVRLWLARHGDELVPTFEAIPEIEALREALIAFVDDDPCSFDHHGGCQAHDPNEGTSECMMARARRVLGWEPA